MKENGNVNDDNDDVTLDSILGQVGDKQRKQRDQRLQPDQRDQAYQEVREAGKKTEVLPHFAKETCGPNCPRLLRSGINSPSSDYWIESPSQRKESRRDREGDGQDFMSPTKASTHRINALSPPHTHICTHAHPQTHTRLRTASASPVGPGSALGTHLPHFAAQGQGPVQQISEQKTPKSSRRHRSFSGGNQTWTDPPLVPSPAVTLQHLLPPPQPQSESESPPEPRAVPTVPTQPIGPAALAALTPTVPAPRKHRLIRASNETVTKLVHARPSPMSDRTAIDGCQPNSSNPLGSASPIVTVRAAPQGVGSSGRHNRACRVPVQRSKVAATDGEVGIGSGDVSTKPSSNSSSTTTFYPRLGALRPHNPPPHPQPQTQPQIQSQHTHTHLQTHTHTQTQSQPRTPEGKPLPPRDCSHIEACGPEFSMLAREGSRSGSGDSDCRIVDSLISDRKIANEPAPIPDYTSSAATNSVPDFQIPKSEHNNQSAGPSRNPSFSARPSQLNPIPTDAHVAPARAQAQAPVLAATPAFASLSTPCQTLVSSSGRKGEADRVERDRLPVTGDAWRNALQVTPSAAQATAALASLLRGQGDGLSRHQSLSRSPQRHHSSASRDRRLADGGRGCTRREGDSSNIKWQKGYALEPLLSPRDSPLLSDREINNDEPSTTYARATSASVRWRGSGHLRDLEAARGPASASLASSPSAGGSPRGTPRSAREAEAEARSARGSPLGFMARGRMAGGRIARGMVAGGMMARGMMAGGMMARGMMAGGMIAGGMTGGRASWLRPARNLGLARRTGPSLKPPFAFGKAHMKDLLHAGSGSPEDQDRFFSINHTWLDYTHQADFWFRDRFHMLLSLSFRALVICLIGFEAFWALLLALALFVSTGGDGERCLGGYVSGLPSYLYFTVETIYTLGYGNPRYPTCALAKVWVVTAVMLTNIVHGTIIGIIFSKFSSGSTRRFAVVFSPHLCGALPHCASRAPASLPEATAPTAQTSPLPSPKLSVLLSSGQKQGPIRTALADIPAALEPDKQFAPSPQMSSSPLPCAHKNTPLLSPPSSGSASGSASALGSGLRSSPGSEYDCDTTSEHARLNVSSRADTAGWLSGVSIYPGAGAENFSISMPSLEAIALHAEALQEQRQINERRRRHAPDDSEARTSQDLSEENDQKCGALALGRKGEPWKRDGVERAGQNEGGDPLVSKLRSPGFKSPATGSPGLKIAGVKSAGLKRPGLKSPRLRSPGLRSPRTGLWPTDRFGHLTTSSANVLSAYKKKRARTAATAFELRKCFQQTYNPLGIQRSRFLHRNSLQQRDHGTEQVSQRTGNVATGNEADDWRTHRQYPGCCRPAETARNLGSNSLQPKIPRFLQSSPKRKGALTHPIIRQQKDAKVDEVIEEALRAPGEHLSDDRLTTAVGGGCDPRTERDIGRLLPIFKQARETLDGPTLGATDANVGSPHTSLTAFDDAHFCLSFRLMNLTDCSFFDPKISIFLLVRSYMSFMSHSPIQTSTHTHTREHRPSVHNDCGCSNMLRRI